MRYDIGRKAALHASFGVRELWVIDAVRLVTRVFRRPTAEGYQDMREVAADEGVIPLIASDAFALWFADLGID